MREPRNGRAWRALRKRVLSEENYCGICNEWVDKTLSGRDPQGPSVNHKRPLTMGGPLLDRANVELAHMACNSSRKNRMPQPVRSRRW